MAQFSKPMAMNCRLQIASKALEKAIIFLNFYGDTRTPLGIYYGATACLGVN